MKKKLFLALFTACAMVCGAFAADRIAVAEPINKGGLSVTDVEALHGMLEASIGGGFEVISRAALKQIMTEIGLTTSSDLMNLNSAQKAKLGQIKTVKYLLVPTLSKFGSRINLAVSVMDSSTADVLPEYSKSLTVRNIDEIADKLDDFLNEIGLAKNVRKRGISALLSPVISVPGTVPAYLPKEFNTLMESVLLNSGVRLYALQNIANILAKNNIDAIHSVEPAMYRRIGELLRADYLIQADINRYELVTNRVYVAPMQRYVEKYIGNIGGTVKIISSSTGLTVASFSFARRINFSDINDDTTDWLIEDYARYLIRTVITPVCAEVVAKVK